MKPLSLLEYVRAAEDWRFDLVFPPDVRELSGVHWTPVDVARRASEFLVRSPGTRVLDIGCGPGKFCIVGALATLGRFTGVEQRKRLSDLGRATIEQANIPNAEIVHGNILEISFSNFDAFYLFNPFQENLETDMKIDGEVVLSEDLYDKYAAHVARQLAMAPLGTRVATYCGSFEEVPLGYDCLGFSLDRLRFWQKTKDHPVRSKCAEAAPVRDRWGYLSGGV